VSCLIDVNVSTREEGEGEKGRPAVGTKLKVSWIGSDLIGM
jgi:hypothetical protein